MLTNQINLLYLPALGVPVDCPKIYKSYPLSGSLTLRSNGRELVDSPWKSPLREHPLLGVLFVGGNVANKRMISRDLKKSRKVAKLYDIAGPLADFCMTLYCIGIPHHDEKGLITADPFDWKIAIHPLSPRPLEDYENALNFLEECKLFKKSPCGKVFKYHNHDQIQSYRNDRKRHTQFPEIKDF